MIKVELGEVWGWKHALRGMRNPMNSWGRADSDIERGFIGKNDADLMRRLYNGGAVHRKYLRQVFVSADITAPLYWWKEYDTYKVGTTANSCSTMHKIAAKPFELDDFSHEHLLVNEKLNTVIQWLNDYREMYVNWVDSSVHVDDYGNVVKKKDIWWQMIQLLPSSYNQKRTVTMNYEVAASMIRQRTGHKLDEWHVFVEMLWTLPYMDTIINGDWGKEGENNGGQKG